MSNHKVGDLVYHRLHGLGIITKIGDDAIKTLMDAWKGISDNFAKENSYLVEWVKEIGVLQAFSHSDIDVLKNYLVNYDKS